MGLYHGGGATCQGTPPAAPGRTACCRACFRVQRIQKHTIPPGFQNTPQRSEDLETHHTYTHCVFNGFRISRYPSVCLSVYLSNHLSIYLSNYLSNHLSIYLNDCPSINVFDLAGLLVVVLACMFTGFRISIHLSV